MRRIGWQGATRARCLRDLMQERFVQWRTGWFGDKWPESSIELAGPDFQAGTETDCWRLASVDGDLAFQVSMDIEPHLAAEALQLHGFRSCVGAVIGKRCFSDLCRSLNGTGDTIGPDRDEQPHGIDRNPRHGGLAFFVSGLPWDLAIAANREWCDRQLPRQTVRRESLVDRRRALGQTRVAVTATIELGEISLLDSTGWREGEVLVGDANRTAPVRLSVRGGAMRTGVLRASHGRRTIAIS